MTYLSLNDMLDVQQIQGDFVTKPQSCKIQDLLREVNMALKEMIRQKYLNYKTNINLPKDMTIYADGQRIQ